MVEVPGLVVSKNGVLADFVPILKGKSDNGASMSEENREVVMVVRAESLSLSPCTFILATISLQILHT